MTKTLIALLSLLLLANISAGQVSTYKNLIDTATDKNIKFVQIKPLTEFELILKTR